MKKKVKTKIINVFSRRIGAVFLVAAMAGSLCAPIVTLVPEAKTVKTTAKKLKNSTIYVGSSKTVSVSSKSKVKWTTSNRKVASVKSASKTKAKITAKNTGTATITGKAGRTKWTMKVSVKRKGSTTKTVKLKAVSLTVGKSKTVTANTKSKVLWSSSNKAVAAVKSAGKNKAKVTAKKAGTAIVTGKAGKTKWTAKVTVKKKSTGGSTKNTADNTLDTTLLDKNIKTMLHSIGADTATSDIQKFARLCRWWSLNVKYDDDLAHYLEYGNYYYDYAKLKDSSLDKYGISNYDSNAFAAAYILELRKGICGFQAKAFKYYCDLLGVKSMCIVGKGRNHEWLHIYLDDGWYTFDPTDFAIYSSITIDDYLNTKEGQHEYDSWLKAAQRVRPNGERKFGETAEESARRLITENAKKNHLYRLANLHAEDDGVEEGLCIGNSDGRGLRLSPYFIDNDGIYKAISDSEEKEHLTGKKYINVFLGDYL